MTLLEIERLSKTFGGLQAISNLDLHVGRGEILGIIGPNGSGKTTLFNLISGLLKPSGGRILWNGENITGRSPDAICRTGIARTFQIVKPFKEMTVLKNVMVGRAYGSSPLRNMAEIESDSEALLMRTGLSGKKYMVTSKLSLLDRKRLELTRALATKPQLLLLDEVMAGLNPTEIEESMELVRAVRESGVTVMIVEHVMKAVLGISDRLVVLHVGRKIAEGSPQEVVQNPKVIEVYLGEPQDARS